MGTGDFTTTPTLAIIAEIKSISRSISNGIEITVTASNTTASTVPKTVPTARKPHPSGVVAITFRNA